MQQPQKCIPYWELKNLRAEIWNSGKTLESVASDAYTLWRSSKLRKEVPEATWHSFYNVLLMQSDRREILNIIYEAL